MIRKPVFPDGKDYWQYYSKFYETYDRRGEIDEAVRQAAYMALAPTCKDYNEFKNPAPNLFKTVLYEWPHDRVLLARTCLFTHHSVVCTGSYRWSGATWDYGGTDGVEEGLDDHIEVLLHFRPFVEAGFLLPILQHRKMTIAEVPVHGEYIRKTTRHEYRAKGLEQIGYAPATFSHKETKGKWFVDLTVPYIGGLPTSEWVSFRKHEAEAFERFHKKLLRLYKASRWLPKEDILPGLGPCAWLSGFFISFRGKACRKCWNVFESASGLVVFKSYSE